MQVRQYATFEQWGIVTAQNIIWDLMNTLDGSCDGFTMMQYHELDKIAHYLWKQLQ